MNATVRLHAADAFRFAFGTAPAVAAEAGTDGEAGIGIYDWRTPDMAGFELPETDELVIALHLGGSRRVRAVTERGLSRACSTPGLVTILPPGRSVAFNTGGSIDVMTLHVPQSVQRISSLEPTLGAGTATARFAFRDAYISASMEALLRAARGSRAPSSDYITKLASALLCHIGQLALTVQPVQPAVKRDAAANLPASPNRKIGGRSLAELLAHIEGSLSRPLPIDELAAHVGISRAAFTRSFHSAMGSTVHQYITQRRVTASMRLLRNTEFDLAWIAQETGFSSQSHFTDTFHALTGSTPRRFREQR
ncbi:AraC family transcriptional regulator [Nevskia sp.]|uniref:helix-turn-helix domain-containing protein n=1 Tax=Nevskia sp. TaxID=1929292 RepID=UPI0025E313B7|nr:AraC family transcriptional regulator [Nevskia sp.]